MAVSRARDERAVREERILDGAAELLLRHGYGRLTIEDVARRAGVGKGTLYLHWRTREELFGAVLTREVAASFEAVADELGRDPRSWRLHLLTRVYFLAIMERPLVKALFQSDPEVLGRLAGRSEARDDRHLAMLVAYLGLLAEHGQLRADLSLEDLALAYSATVSGFLRLESFEGAAGGPDQPLSDTELERRADLLAATVRSAFESGQQVSEVTEIAIGRQLGDLLRRLAAADRDGLSAPTVGASSEGGSRS